MGFDISYTYDEAGNRLTKTEVAGASSIVTTSSYDDANRILTSNRAGQITTYAHDAAGNRTQVAYEDAVRGLPAKYDELVKSGKGGEELGRAMNAERLKLEEQFRKGLRPEILAEIEQRQLAAYGNKLGATPEWLREQGKSWEQIAQGAMKPGGRDMWKIFFGE